MYSMAFKLFEVQIWSQANSRKGLKNGINVRNVHCLCGEVSFVFIARFELFFINFKQK